MRTVPVSGTKVPETHHAPPESARSREVDLLHGWAQMRLSVYGHVLAHAIRSGFRGEKSVFGAVLMLGCALRVVSILVAPLEMTNDEARLVFNAAALAFAGIDETGRSWPILPNGSGWPQNVPALYAGVLATTVFGSTNFVRVMGAIVGTGALMLIGRVAYLLFGSRAAGVGAAALLAISPWHLQLTRMGLDEVWVVTGTLLLVAGLLEIAHDRAATFRRQTLMVVGSVVGGVVGMWASPTASLTVPLLALGTIGTFAAFRLLNRRHMLPILVVAGAVTLGVLPLIGMRDWGIAPSRTELDRIAKQSTRRLETASSGLVGIMQLPEAIGARLRVHAYFSYFDPSYLFTRGDPDQRRHPTGHGQASVLDLLLVLVGMGCVANIGLSAPRVGLRHALARPEVLGSGWAVAFVWIVIAPLPAAMAFLVGDSTRSVGQLLGLLLLEAGAIASVWPLVQRRRVVFETALAGGLAVVVWALATFVHGPVEVARAWGPTPATFARAKAEVATGRYDRIILTPDVAYTLPAALIGLGVTPATYFLAGGANMWNQVDGPPQATFGLLDIRAVDWTAELRRDDARTTLYVIDGPARIPTGFQTVGPAETRYQPLRLITRDGQSTQ